MSRHKNLAVLGLALALATGACGSDQTPDTSAASTSTTAAAIETSETPIESTTTTATPTTSQSSDATEVDTDTTGNTDTTDDVASSSTTLAEPVETSGPQTSEVAAEEPTTTSTSVSIPEVAEEFAEPSGDVLIEAVTRSLIDDQQAEAYPTSETELRCVSSSVVADIGKDKLVAAGMNEDGSGSFRPADLAEPDQQLLVSAFLSCVNIENVFASQVGSGGSLDETTARCLAREMNTSGLLEDLLRPSILGATAPAISDQDPEIQDAFLEAFRACLDFEDEMARGFMQDGVVSESSARCLAARMDDEGLLDRIMRTQVTGTPLTPEQDVEAQALMLDLARECLTEAEAERLSLG